MTSECPGKRSCHGCATWCPRCDDVSNVCDFDECAFHLRLDELKAMEKSLVSTILSRRDELRSLESEISEVRERIKSAQGPNAIMKSRPPGWGHR